MTITNNDKKITVCSSCLRASCWQGVFICTNHRRAGIVKMSINELRKLKLEHKDYWYK